MDEKPEWLTSLSAMKGAGGFAAEKGTASLKPSVIDRLEEYNKELQIAEPKGSAGNYYNLSNSKGEDFVENTANCYLISAPGYYRLPLVYGNGVKNNQSDEKAFKRTLQGTNILKVFKDHAGKEITSGYIDVQNTDNLAIKADVVWADQSGLVENPSVNESFLQFHVSKEKIRSGNAVIAVKDAQGTIMWSWHLWFAKKEALDIVEVQSKEGKTYKFTKETLGFAYTKWKGTSYDKAREVRVKIAQTVANGGVKKEAIITIIQKPGGEKEVSSTYYQFGRKDPFPTANYTTGAPFVPKVEGAQEISTLIQHPGTFYTVNNSPYDAYKTTYNNLWSMNNSGIGFKDEEVVKTIYAPCPVGFKMPPSNAFTGFTITGEKPRTQPEWRISRTWDNGWHFKGKEGTTNTVYFPAAGLRNYHVGSLSEQNEKGRYWSAVPYDTTEGCGLIFSETDMNPKFTDHRAQGFSVRPIAE